MKKILILAAVAALALTACKKDPAPTPGPTPTPVSEFITGSGTIADPYVLYKAEHLDSLAILADLKDWKEEKRDAYFTAVDSTCFKLGNDIDCKSAERTPIDLAMDKTKGKKIDFNGAGFAIKNFKVTGSEKVGLFSNLVGNIHDLKVTGADVTFTGKKGGILVGQASTGNAIYTNIYNCYVQGKVAYTGDGTVDTEVSLGGLVGQQCFGRVSCCEVDAELVCGGKAGEHYVGGIMGSFGKDSCPVSNCITRGNYHSTEGSDTYMFGGIAGCSQKQGFTITNCISLAKINCKDFAGGIVGLLNYNKVQENCHGSAKDCEVKGCIAWNDEIKANGPKILDSGIKLGAIVAWGSVGDNYSSCWRNPALTGFSDDADHVKDPDYSGKPCIIYNGKAAAAGKTASAVAKELGWDETIWDLSGDVPALKCLK